MSDISLLEQAISFVLHIDQHLFALVAEYGAMLYLFLFIVVFCETGLVVTPFLPGDSLLFAAGTVAGAGHLSYPVCMLVLLGAAVLGDAVNYEIGRHVGPSIFNRETRFLNKQHLLKAHAFYEKHGGKAIILAHGGDIEASNRAGGGACFRFRLPMKEVNHESDDYAADRRG